MKQIQELIKATQVLRVEGNSDTRVSRLAYDSRRIAPGDCFFAVSGTQSDGHAYIDAAVAARSEERRVGKEWRSRWSPYH